MNEKVYRSMSLSGACNIAVGIVILVVGIVAGVMAIISGAGLLKNKKNIMQRQSMIITDWILMCFSDRHTRESHSAWQPLWQSVNYMEKIFVTALTARK